jgi:hypothetical protein
MVAGYIPIPRYPSKQPLGTTSFFLSTPLSQELGGQASWLTPSLEIAD